MAFNPSFGPGAQSGFQRPAMPQMPGQGVMTPEQLQAMLQARQQGGQPGAGGFQGGGQQPSWGAPPPGGSAPFMSPGMGPAGQMPGMGPMTMQGGQMGGMSGGAGNGIGATGGFLSGPPMNRTQGNDPAFIRNLLAMIDQRRTQGGQGGQGGMGSQTAGGQGQNPGGNSRAPGGWA